MSVRKFRPFVRWNDLRVPMSTGKASSTPPTYGVFRNGLEAWGFSKTLTNELFAEVQLPHGYVNGSDLYAHIHWSPGNSTDTGNVVWSLEYTWANFNAAFPASTTITKTQAAAGVAYQHQLASFAAISGAGKTESSLLMVRVARLGADGSDTFDAVAYGLSFDIHHEVTTLGSATEIPT